MINSRSSRRALTTILIAVLLAGCGFVNTGSDAGSDGASGSATLKGFVNTSQKKALDTVLPACQEQTGATVELTQMSTDDLNQQLRVQLSSGTAPDLFRVSPGNSSPVAAGILGKSGDLADISSGAWTDQLSDASRPLAEVDGKVLAFPTSSNAIVVAYNKSVFDDHGLTAPTTWTELMSTSAALKKEGITPISAGFVEGVAIQFPVYALAASLVYGPTPDIDEQMAAGETSFSENAAWQEVFTKFDSLVKQGYLTEDSLGTPEDQAMQALAGGKAGMMVVVSAGLPSLYEYSENGASDFGVFALPATDDADETYVPLAPDFLAVNAAGDNVEAATRMIDCLAEPKNVNAAAEAIESLPGLEIDDPAMPDDLTGIEPLLTGGKSAPFANYMWPNADTQQRLLQSGQELVDGSIDVKELTKQLDTEYAEGTP
jgi:raffinose/stachyose/melibiose transport system substrate-binding protein